MENPTQQINSILKSNIALKYILLWYKIVQKGLKNGQIVGNNCLSLIFKINANNRRIIILYYCII